MSQNSPPANRVTMSMGSTAKLPAKEVLRLATLSLQEIHSQRLRAQNIAWDFVKDQMCSHYYGLYKHKRYPTREHAEEFSPEFKMAGNVGWGDYRTCETLADFAKKLMEFDPDAEMTITADDFRALS